VAVQRDGLVEGILGASWCSLYYQPAIPSLPETILVAFRNRISEKQAEGSEQKAVRNTQLDASAPMEDCLLLAAYS
jgi:hypothetical protein